MCWFDNVVLLELDGDHLSVSMGYHVVTGVNYVEDQIDYCERRSGELGEPP